MEGISISNKEYRAKDGVSSTDLKQMTKSPAHFRYWKDNPQEDTPALLFGRAVHKYVLEKDDFFSEFAVMPNYDRRTKEGKAAWLLFLDQNAGKDIITAEDFETVKAMREALYSTPFVEKLLSGRKELSFFRKDDSTGLTMKCRPDCLTTLEDMHLLIDYKSTTDASNDAFMRDAIKLKYDMQMGYYKDIVDAELGREHEVVFIAQEKSAPYVVNILAANEYFIKSGRDMYRTYLDMYAECDSTGNWYGFVKDGVNTLGLPGWLQRQYGNNESEE
ncbi:MAG: PD-(D/E)XK nuclease-like domain-containing protein [Bacteroidaceae bacterium]|nr:PD-(D/E)XK nuclease-like domain-containing protein [Bacteroidaceae bacterium]